MSNPTILYSKISAAVIAVVLSIALLLPSGIAPALEWIPLMCYAANAPEPDVPLITYGEFPFTVVYKVNGEEYTIEDTVICEYVGSRWNEGDGEKHRIWEQRFESGPNVIICPIDPSGFVGADEAFVALNVGCSAWLLMGDNESSSYADAYLYIRLGENGYAFRSSDEIYESYGARLISFEMYAPPIENTFIPADEVDSVKKQASEGISVDKNGIEYTVDSATKQATVVGYSGEATALEIPAKVRGIDVVAIADGAFARCYNLVSVTIPDSVTRIGESAFERCHRLESITLPDSITSIGKSAFAYCTSLESVDLPANLTVIEEMTFCDCRNLEEVTLPDNLESIGRMAFANCPVWRDIMFPKK